MEKQKFCRVAPDLHPGIKAAAALRRVSITSLVDQILREWVALNAGAIQVEPRVEQEDTATASVA